MIETNTNNETEKMFHLVIDEENIATITIDMPGDRVNKLHSKYLAEVDHLFEILKKKEIKGLILISGKEDSFIVGADIRELKSLKTKEELVELSKRGQEVIHRFSEVPFPTVAAIHGTCVGGGCELVLAFTYRLLTPDPKSQIGLPEVKVGLIPGAGGTQRLPRLIGLVPALDLILKGSNVRPQKALRLGLVDEVVHKNLLIPRAKQVIRELSQRTLIPKRAKLTKMQRFLGNTNIGRGLLKTQITKTLDKETLGNYSAPYKALEACLEGFPLQFIRDGLAIEARLFGEAAFTDIANSLMGLFDSMTETKKQFDKNLAKPVTTVGILGGGFMGSGIATVSVEAGLRARVKDQNDASLSRTYQYVQKVIQGKVKKKHLTPYEGQMQLDKMSTSVDYSGFKNAEIVVEAVFEDVDLKQKVLADLENLGNDSLIFASNTSSIPIGLIAEKAKRKELVIGMHFFSPVEKMPLLEIIVTKDTADWVTATAASLGIAMGKTVIIVNDGWGFYTSRTLGPFINEGLHLLMEGARVDTIDQTLIKGGFPVGALKLLDEVGIDIAMKVNKLMEAHMGGRLTPPKGYDSVMEEDRKGRKTGKGFYTYNTKKKMVDLTIYDKLPFGRKRKEFSATEIYERCLFAFINEAAYCLSENILRSPADGDVGAILGLGFPPFLGGPFRYLDRIGLPKAYDILKRLEEKHGERFKPAPIIAEYATQQKKFFA